MSRSAKYKSLKYKELREILEAHLRQAKRDEFKSRFGVPKVLGYEKAIRLLPKTPNEFVGQEYIDALAEDAQSLRESATKWAEEDSGCIATAHYLHWASVLDDVAKSLRRKT